MKKLIPTGCSSIDESLGGGLAEGVIILVFGEAETGKTTLAIQCAVNCARMGYKTLFIDCNHTFFPKRMAQIAGDDFESLAPHVILMRPRDFKQQTLAFDELNDFISKKVGLLVVDTITSLYSENIGGEAKKGFALNRELNRQMAGLAQISKTQKVASLVISQVRSVVFQEQAVVQPVATRVLKFWADTTINLKPTSRSDVVTASVETHRPRHAVKKAFLKIEEKGLRDYKS